MLQIPLAHLVHVEALLSFSAAVEHVELAQFHLAEVRGNRDVRSVVGVGAGQPLGKVNFHFIF